MNPKVIGRLDVPPCLRTALNISRTNTFYFTSNSCLEGLNSMTFGLKEIDPLFFNDRSV